jgi:outer membrane protein insertion porin family
MKRLLYATLFTTVLLQAQEIKSIKFDGLIHLSPDIAQEIIGMHPGEDIDIEKVDQAIKKLYSQKYFKDIWVTEERGVLTFHFTEKPVISQVELSGYGENKKDEVLSQIGLKKGDIYDEERIEKAKATLLGIVEQEGYFDTVVEVITEPLKNGSVKIEFAVNKGENIIIEKLNLCGAKSFSKGDLESVIANKERDFMGWMWGLNDGKVNIDQLKYDAPRIRDYYMRHGYLDAQVDDPLLRVDFDQYSAILDYKITEGPVYEIKDIKIVLDKPVIDVKELEENLKLHKGEVFNIEKMRKDIQNIRKKIADIGYAYVRVIPDFKKDPKNHKVVLNYIIIPGKKVYIKDVIITGNNRTLDRVIRREVYLAPGDTYSLTDLKDSKSALMRTGYFEKVLIDERRINDHEMELVVTVKETQTGNIMIGGGYGSYDGFIVNASINDRNVLGSGIALGFSLDFSKYRNNFNFSVTNPRVWDSDYSASVNLFNSKYESYDYTQNKKGGSLTVGKKTSRYWYTSVSYQYFTTELTGMDPAYPDYDLYNGKGFTTSAITPAIRFNNTDNYYTPREGIIFSASSEYAGIGGDAKFSKNYFRFATYKGLEDYINYDLILRYKAQVGLIPWEENLPVNEKFFMGGIRSVRGYKSGSISLKDENGYLLGGKYMFSNSIEASIPLIESARMRLTLFFDYGMIGENSFTDEKRAGSGFAIEWFSPMGPINLIFANPLMTKEGDQTSSFEFTMGTQF